MDVEVVGGSYQSLRHLEIVSERTLWPTHLVMEAILLLQLVMLLLGLVRNYVLVYWMVNRLSQNLVKASKLISQRDCSTVTENRIL